MWLSKRGQTSKIIQLLRDLGPVKVFSYRNKFESFTSLSYGRPKKLLFRGKKDRREREKEMNPPGILHDLMSAWTLQQCLIFSTCVHK